MKVTDEMIQAAVSSLVKDKIIPKHSDIDGYTHTWESIERALLAALGEAK